MKRGEVPVCTFHGITSKRKMLVRMWSLDGVQSFLFCRPLACWRADKDVSASQDLSKGIQGPGVVHSSGLPEEAHG